MDNWISVKSGQPPKNKWCLVYRPEFCEVVVAMYILERGCWIDKRGFAYSESTFSHWMPLPQLPKGE